MNVKIAKQHLRVMAVSILARCRPHHALRRGLEQLDRPAAGRVVARLAQDEPGDAQRGIGVADRFEIFTPLGPERGAFGKGLFHQFGHLAVFLPNRADILPPDQFRIAFLLAGNDLVDDHRTARGDGFLHRRAARLADDQMMRPHQFGHLIRPAQHAHAVGLFARPFNQFRAQGSVASGGDGEMHIVEFEQPVNRLACLFLAGVDKVQHAARLLPDRRRQFRRGFGEHRVHRKTEHLDLLVRHAVLAQHIGGGLVGHAEKIARGPEPRGIDGDGIGDDGDEPERPLVVAVNFLDDVAVNGVGGDDAIRLRLGQDFFERALQPGEIPELLFDEWRIVEQ